MRRIERATNPSIGTVNIGTMLDQKSGNIDVTVEEKREEGKGKLARKGGQFD